MSLIVFTDNYLRTQHDIYSTWNSLHFHKQVHAPKYLEFTQQLQRLHMRIQTLYVDEQYFN